MTGHGQSFLKYAQHFRATGDERPVTPARPIQKDEPVKVPSVNFGELLEWIAGPLATIWEPYSLLGKNCQNFVDDLIKFLCEGQTAEKALLKIRSDPDIVLEAVRRDGLLLKYAAPALKGDL